MPKCPHALTALACCSALLVSSMDAAAAHRTRANAYLRGNAAEAALRECDSGLAGRPGDAGLLILRGKALFGLDRLGDAKVAYDKSLEAGGHFSEAYLGLAMIASRRNDWPAAKQNFEELVRLNDKD